MTTTNQGSQTRDKSDRGVVDDAAIGHDDYSLSRVPEDKRYHWFTMAVQRFGMLSALGQFALGAFLGFGMEFWPAMLAIVLGSVLLEVVTIFVGIAGMREGLNTSLLARWSGFGTIGAALLGLVLSISLVGWFAFQTNIFAQGLQSFMGGVPFALLALIGGIVVTLIVVYGIKIMNYVAYVAVPLFLILVTVNFIIALQSHNLNELMNHKPVGAPLSLAAGTTIVAGGFIAGAIFTPDMSRFNRSVSDVVKQTVVGVTLGEFYVGVLGVLLAHTLKEVVKGSEGQIIGLLQGNLGWVAAIAICLSIIKVNDWNLYPSSLGLTNAIHGLSGIRINRVYVAIGLGIIGSVIAMFPTGDWFTTFLGYLGMGFPGIAAVMIADYFILKTHRAELDKSRAEFGRLPATAPLLVPAGLAAWIIGFLVAWIMSMNPHFLEPINVPAIIALVVSFLVYWGLGAAGLNKGIGSAVTPQPALSNN